MQVIFFVLSACYSIMALAVEIPTCHQLPARFPDNSMVKIPAGTFSMGTDATNAYDSERPLHKVQLKEYWIDKTEVTVEEFMKFVDSNNYKTVAEFVPDWNELKKQLPKDSLPPDPSTLVAASLVFSPVTKGADMERLNWWRWVPGAYWKAPEGPGSDIKLRLNHPVVHVALKDAKAYCAWKGKRLPTEAEWEFAARGGLEKKYYAWGDSFKLEQRYMANTYQGEFPKKDSKEDGFAGTSPVMSFPPNGYGIYDMIGNVWEWTSDFYDENYYKKIDLKKILVNPAGPARPYDPREPLAIKHVVKGGSFLCADNFCVNYRPSARLGQTFDTGTSHIGFRCVKD